MLEWATRRAESNELSSVQIGWVVVELIAGIFLHVLEHQQSKTETTLESGVLEMLEWATR